MRRNTRLLIGFALVWALFVLYFMHRSMGTDDSKNPALKLKHSVILEELKKYGSSKPVSSVKQGDVSLDVVYTNLNSKLQWQYFDEEAYIAKTKIQPGQDAYARNKFNQAASDKLKSNRDIPDTRNPRSMLVNNIP